MTTDLKIGATVKCVNGRFFGYVGIVNYYDPDAHEDVFCMRVYPDVGERVNPSNWIIEPGVLFPITPVDRDGEPLLNKEHFDKR